MTAVSRYATPTAFRRALIDRLKTLSGTSRWTMPQLQRHVAYDRLLDQITALVSEFDRRQLNLPTSFDVPDRRLWESGYIAEARRSLLAAGRTLNEAPTLVKPFIDPLLDQSATGHWDPGSRQWLEA